MNRSGDACYYYLFGGGGSELPDGTFSESETTEFSAAIAVVIEAAQTNPVAPGLTSAAEAHLEELMTRLGEEYGEDALDDFILLDSASLTFDERRQVCQLTVWMYGVALEFNEPARSEVLRYLFSDI